MRARVRGYRTAWTRGGCLAVFALVALVAALGGSGTAQAGFFTGNTTGIASITGDGQSAVLIGGTYYLFLPSNYGGSTVPVTVTAASASNNVSIGTQSVLVASPDTYSVDVNSGSTISICTPSASGTGDPSHCDHFNFSVLPTASFDTNLRALSASPGGVSFSWSLSGEATTYATRVPARTPSVTVNASPEDPLASVYINGVAGTSRSVPVEEFGLTNITVQVVAFNGTDFTNYTIAVTAGNNDAKLSNLTISPGTITGFSPTTTTYDVKVPSSATQVNVTPTLDDPNGYWFINNLQASTTVQEETDSLPHPITLNLTDPTTLFVIASAEDTIADSVYTLNITHLVSRVLDVGFTGSGNGVVKSTSPDTVVNCASPSTGTCTTHYDETASVTLSETSAVGSYFVGWSGDCSGAATTASFTMPSHTATCTANFASLGPKQTSPFTVTTGQDVTDGGCYANRCSLRDALAAASSAGGTIKFAGGVAEIDPTSTLTYTGKPLTITGSVTISGTHLPADTTLLALSGTVTLTNVEIDDAPGTGLVMEGTLTMKGGGFSGNSSGGCGGFDIAGTATMTNVEVAGNASTAFDSGGGGGGCVEASSSLTVTGSVFAGNTAFSGGGISDGGTLTVRDTQFLGNGWPFEFDTGPGLGAGIFVDNTGTATVTNATFTDNGGAGAFDVFGHATLASSTVAGNEYGASGTISILNSIVDGNGADCGGGLTSLGHNLLGTGCPFGISSDRTTDDAGLGSPTPSGLIPLENGSPALDAGFAGTVSGVTAPATDTAGTARPQGGGVDIGALEMTEHKLTIKTAGAGTGTVAPDVPATTAAGVAAPGGWYVAGSTVHLTATPTGGSAFASWSGACTGTSPTVDVSVTADETCTATFAPKPVVTSFSPASGRVGTTVTITGSKFTGVTGVQFGGADAASFKVVSDTQITAVVPVGAVDGVITVSNTDLSTDSAQSFDYVWVKPVVTSFTPATLKVGTPVTLTGTDFLGTSVVDFNGTPGTGLNVVSDTKITVNAPAGATSGPITVTNPGGTGVSKTNFTFLSPPSAVTFSPEHAAFGALVTVSGGHFTGSTVVTVDGVSVTFTIVNDSTITFRVPTNAADGSGPVAVTNAGGTTQSVDSFTLDWATPAVTSFAPASARIRAVVTINGTGFTRANEVDFGAHASPVVTVVSDTRITAVVPDNVGTSAVAVTVKRPGGSAGVSVSNFTPIWPAPAITSFAPASAKAGATVTITGTGFLGATAVSFNGHAATVSGAVTDTSVKVIVPDNLDDTGKISLTTPGGTVQSAGNFTFLSPPVITTFTGHAAFGASVTIEGSHFTGTTAVKIGGATATFHLVNDGQLNATVPTGASNTPGPISVTNANGTTLSATNFTLDWATPAVTSFAPASARIRAVVTINGTGFTRANEVDFGAHASPVVTVVSDTRITAVVPDNVGTSAVAVTVKRPGGSAGVSVSNFTPIWPAPAITSFAPASAKAGATVTITGTGFLGATAVSFNGHAATVSGAVTDTSVKVIVPDNLDDTGKISLTTPGGTVQSAGNFTFLSPPVITTFTGHAAFGASVTIEGSHFTGTTAVKIGGATATFHLVNDGQLNATVPTGASNTPGPISVTNANGTTLSATNFTLDWATPTITSFAPATGRIGTKITITGTHFTRATGVTIGLTPATSVTVVSDTKLTAVIPTDVAAGAQHITVSNPGATSTASTGTFTPTFPTPTITSFTPTTGISGVTVTITGTGFLGATEVDIGGAAALTFTVVSDTKITVVVPTLGATGHISVTTLGGTATSAGTFTISA